MTHELAKLAVIFFASAGIGALTTTVAIAAAQKTGRR